ncbi:DNA polymerase IV [Patescibacteria group bacterium]|nr:DNA polymerase IV [Patescibacteria group bacterium]
MSIILHVDFNSFFASVEQQANPFLRGKPIAITGKRGIKDMKRSIVATASIEAKRLAVKTPMPVMEAKRICPELILLPGDMRKYSEITDRMLRVLRENSDKIEQFSTDEAFADITSIAQDYFGATIIAQIIRNQIAQACGELCSVSIGVGPSKTIAKLASGETKPNGLTIVQPSEVISYLDKKPLEDVCGIGRATIKHLESIGISSFQTLRMASMKKLVHEFKPITGMWLYNIARGIEHDGVNDSQEDPKSIGHSYTFAHDLEFDAEIKTNLLSIADTVALRLRKMKFKAGHISLLVRYNDFSSNHIGIKLTNSVNDGLSIYKYASQLLNKVRDINKPIRLLGISTSQFSNLEKPVSLFLKDQKMQSALCAQDCILEKFGNRALCRAATISSVFQERASGWHYDHQL